MSAYDVSAATKRLRASRKLETLFSILREYGGIAAARWLEGDDEKNMTYAELAARSDDCASLLCSLAPGEGGWVALALETCPDWPVLFWALLRSGHSVLLLDASAADSLIQSLMEEAGCRMIITRRPRKLPPSFRQIEPKTVLSAPRAENYVPVWGDQVAMCTSGTTGRARVFVYSGASLCGQALNSALIMGENTRVIANENRRFLAFLPFHHVLGFMTNVIWGEFLGMTMLYLPDRSPASLLKTCQRLRPQLLVVVPLVGNSLVRELEKSLSRESLGKRAVFRLMKSLSLALQKLAPEAGLRFAEKRLFASVNERLLGTDVECIILGGGHTPRNTLKVLNALGYSTITGYGMTETAVTGLETSLRLGVRLSGSVGRALETAEYRMTPEKELQIRGDGIHTGRLSGGQMLPPGTDAEGWFSTGDLVTMDHRGRLYIRGRLKDVIVNESGENIYPDDREEPFAGLPGVDQLCVLGLPQTGRSKLHPIHGVNSNEHVTLILSVGSRYGDPAWLSSLAGKVSERNDRLPAASRVRRVLVTPEALPLSNGIKVKRLELKHLCASKRLTCRELDLTTRKVGDEVSVAGQEKEESPRRDDIREGVRALFAEALGKPAIEIPDGAHFIDDLGGDSLQVLGMVLKAEETWGVTLSAEEYGRCATVNGMTRYIQQLMEGRAADSPKERVPVIPLIRFEDTPEYQAFRRRQEDLARGGDNPYFVRHESPLLDTGIVDGKEILEFGSYNYAGMSGRKEIREAAKAAIDKYGTSASGSRLLAGEKQVHEDLEKAIAEWKHTEDALVCVGGHSTNVTFIGNFCGQGDLILYDALAHNSVEQGCRLSEAVARPFPHNDYAALEQILRAQRSYYAKVLIVIEGVYSMDGDIAPVPEFVRVKKDYGCFLMVDEAHSACVLGPTGGGVDEYFGLAGDDIDIKYGTLSKGLGTCGGYLAGSRSLIEYLRYNLPGFVFSVGISPGLAAASLEAIRLLRTRPEIMEQLHGAIRAFAESARRRHLDICLAGETAVLPVLVGRDEDAWLLSNELKKRGVSVPPAMYPAVPKGKARLRFCVISEHKPEQIERALDLLEATARDFGIHLPRRDYA